MPNWTFHNQGQRTRATLDITINRGQWELDFKVMDLQDNLVDRHRFVLEGLWLTVIKTMIRKEGI